MIGFTAMLRHFRIAAAAIRAARGRRLRHQGAAGAAAAAAPHRLQPNLRRARARRGAGRDRPREKPSPRLPSASLERVCPSRRRALRRARAAVGIAAEFGTPCYVVFARRARNPHGASSTPPSRHPAPRLLRDEGEPEPRGARPLRAPRQRLRHRLRRRIGARARGGRRSRPRSCSRGSASRKRRWRRRSPLGILCFNVESASELDRLDAVAGRAGRVAPVSFRVNPDVDPQTHPYISTGLEGKQVRHRLRRRAPALSAGGSAAEHRGPRPRHPHRLPDHRTGAVSRSRAARCWSWSTAWRPRGYRSRISISAAASASATATRRRCRSRSTRR